MVKPLKISIVTPSFNQATFLKAAIESVLSQNYPNLEYIIIDGGSSDGSIEIIKKYEKHLRYWCSEPDQGQYYAINKGFQHATGDIMAWLNSDDMYFPWTFRTVGSILHDLPEVDWLTTLNAGWWDWQGYNTGFSPLPGFSKDAFLNGSYIPWSKGQLGWIQQESTFWRRSLWEKAGKGINTNYKLAGDFDLWAQFYLHADLVGTSSALGGFRSQADQKSGQKELYISEALQSLQQMKSATGWSESLLKKSLRNLKLHKVPKIREALISQTGYSGKKIIRQNGQFPSGSWVIENYLFS